MSDIADGYAIMISAGAMIAILLAALAVAPTADTDAPLAQSLVRRLEERQARAQDMTARFVQSYRSGILGREVVERGIVRLKRPGRMLWEYKDPEKKTFLSDGKSYYFYVPADRQVIVRDQDEERGVATRLLSGKGGLLQEFEVSLDAPPAEGVYRLRLSPRKEDPEIQVLIVDVEPSGLLRAIQVEDAQGNRSRFRFDEVRENTGLPDRLFRFEVPPGVEVIRG
jgi:outer membrane lipoprotein carrier protein